MVGKKWSVARDDLRSFCSDKWATRNGFSITVDKLSVFDVKRCNSISTIKMKYGRWTQLQILRTFFIQHYFSFRFFSSFRFLLQHFLDGCKKGFHDYITDPVVIASHRPCEWYVGERHQWRLWKLKPYLKIKI